MNWVQPAKRRQRKKAPRSGWLLALGVGVLLLPPALQVEADDASSWGLPDQGFGHVIQVLDDQSLGGIRGKYVAGGAENIDAVILWDERPGGLGDERGGRGSGQESNHSLGLGNDQITSVTTQRSHSP